MGATESKIVELKLYAFETWTSSPVSSIWMVGLGPRSRLGSSRKAQAFDYPKPKDLIAQIVSFVTGPGDLVLDSFAGSGTTGHAVLDPQRPGWRRAPLHLGRDAARDRARRDGRAPASGDRGLQQGWRPGEARAGPRRRFPPLPPRHAALRRVRRHPGRGHVPRPRRPRLLLRDRRAHSRARHLIPPRCPRQPGRLPPLRRRSVGTPREAAGNVLTPDRLAALPLRPEGTAAVVYAEGCTASPRAPARPRRQLPPDPYQIAGAG